MADIVIIPYEGFESVHFGDKRESVRAKLGKYTEFKKSECSENTTDDFGFCHIFYTSDDKIDAIEFFPESEITFKEKPLFAFDFSVLKDFLADENIEEDDSGANFPKYGMSVYTPDSEEIESILIYSKSYWED